MATRKPDGRSKTAKKASSIRLKAEKARLKRAVPTPTAKAKAKKAIPAKAKAPSTAKKATAPKKKLGNAKAKPTVRKATKHTGDHWFAKLTKKAQAEYIKAHPNSKFAKGAKVKAVAKSAKKEIKSDVNATAKLHKKADSEHHMLGKKVYTQSHRVIDAQKRVERAKTPEKKKEAKNKLRVVNAAFKNLQKQHKVAEKLKTRLGKQVEKEKAKAVKSVTKKPAAKKPATKKVTIVSRGIKKTVKAPIKLKSGKISVRMNGPHSAKTAKASQIRDKIRREKLRSKRN